MIDFRKSDAEFEREIEEADKSSLKSQKKAFVILCIAVLAICIPISLIFGYFAYDNYQSYISHTKLDAHNLEAEGILKDEYTEVTRRGSKTFRMSYSFKVNGQTYQGTSELFLKPTESRVTVIYYPENPNINKIKGGKDEYEYSTAPFIAVLIVGVIASLILGLAGKKKTENQTQGKIPPKSYSKPHPQTPLETPTQSGKIQISSQSITWIEKEILTLNQEINDDDRPEFNSNFFQTLPKSLLEKEVLGAPDISEAVIHLVKQTRERIDKIDSSFGNKLEIPFSKPRVEFTTNLPENEPGHIEFGNNETIIRIHPKYVDNPFALASILCHELAHFILNHNGLRKSDRKENEKLTDLFVFRCGQGLIYLQGILDITNENGHRIESRLGYLTLEEMAYAHVRCASQHGLNSSTIRPDFFSGKAFDEVDKAIEFLSIKKDSNSTLAEVILCPNNHILRITREKKLHSIRCPKCKCEKELWMYKRDHFDALINTGKTYFNSSDFTVALKNFRGAQEVNKRDSLAYCLASRCLKRLGKHQDAIRELQKLLSICPEDKMAQDEMKKLIYS